MLFISAPLKNERGTEVKIDGVTLGRYGRMRREFIKNERTELLFLAGLEKYLAQIDTRIKERIRGLVQHSLLKSSPQKCVNSLGTVRPRIPESYS